MFCCALIHGLGLADGLRDLGVNRSHLGWSLAGFNAGIELAQVAVAALFIAVMQALRLATGPGGPVMAARLASVVGMVAGLCWFAERLAQAPVLHSKFALASDSNMACPRIDNVSPHPACADPPVRWDRWQL